MCKCDPSLRIPYCGRGDCIWPDKATHKSTIYPEVSSVQEYNKRELFKAMDKFQQEYLHGCPVVQSTFPDFLDPRNELILKLFKYAIVELGYDHTWKSQDTMDKQS